MGSIQISLLFLMVYACVNKIKGKLVKIHNKVKASIDYQTKPLKTILKLFTLKIASNRGKICVTSTNLHLSILMRFKQNNTKNIVKFSLNLKFR